MVQAKQSGIGWIYLAWGVLAVVVLLGVISEAGAVLSGIGSLRVSGDLAGIHKTFALVLFPVALLAAAWARSVGAYSARLCGLALFLGASGALLALAVPLVSRGKMLASSLPLAEHPLHGAAIALFLVSVALVLVAKLWGQRESALRCGDPYFWYLLVPIGAMVFSGWWAWEVSAELPLPVRLSYALWGPVYLMPLVTAMLLMQGWLWLLGSAHVPGRTVRILIHGCFALAGLPALAVIPLQLETPIADPAYLNAFDWLMRRALWPGALLLALLLWRSFVRARQTVPLTHFLAYGGSFALFFFGFCLSWLPDETSTLFQSFAHLTGGAVSLVLLTLGTRWGLAWEPSVSAAPVARSWEMVSVGAGFAVVAAGLAAAGLAYLVVPDAEVSVIFPGRIVALLGGLLVAIAAVAAGLRQLSGRFPQASSRAVGGLADALRTLDVRVKAVAATGLGIAVLGGIIALIPSLDRPRVAAPLSGPASAQHAHVAGQLRQEIQTRFDQGVVMLNLKRFDEAATAFHRVMELAPEMPEAHVNMGFAMLGKGEYGMARDFFDGATELRKDQLNAYYGLALAYEGLGNFEAAMGAMRTYQHLTRPDDPYLPKVNAKLREYAARARPGGAAGGA